MSISKKQEQIFKNACLGALFAFDEGLMSKSPDYIFEKATRLCDCRVAWHTLHPTLQSYVRAWAKKWNFPIDELLETFNK